MNTTEIMLERPNLSIRESKDLLIKIANQQINHYKIQRLAEWERNHTSSNKNRNKVLELLNTKKQEIEEIFRQFNKEDALVDISFSIKIKTNESKLIDSVES